MDNPKLKSDAVPQSVDGELTANTDSNTTLDVPAEPRTTPKNRSAIGDYIPLLSVIVAVLGLLIGVVQNNKARSDELIRDENSRKAQADRDMLIEFKKPFWQKRVEMYGKVVHLASLIATTDDISERKRSFAEFDVLYNGEMIILEDSKIRTEMETFKFTYLE